MVAEMANTYATRLGPAPYLQLVSELQHHHHAELELMYLAAVEHFGLEGLQVPPFSAFNDPLLYASAPPSVQYCKSIFTDWFARVRIYLERTIVALSATCLAGDHTFNMGTLICVPILLSRLQVIKKMGGMKGVPIHKALYSMINEYEEAHNSAMVPTKALSYVSEVYEGIKTSLEKTEQEPTQVIYCDQPEGASFKNKSIAKIYFLQLNSHFAKVSMIHFVKGYDIDLSGLFWHRLFMPASCTPCIVTRMLLKQVAMKFLMVAFRIMVRLSTMQSLQLQPHTSKETHQLYSLFSSDLQDIFTFLM